MDKKKVTGRQTVSGKLSKNSRRKTRLKTARGRKSSSTKWLERQLNDPYVKKAHDMGYRSRSTFKIIEINDKFHIFKKGYTVVDLGAAPGGWSQIAAQKCGNGNVIALDLLPIEPIDGVKCFESDFTSNEALKILEENLSQYDNGKVNVVMSDMAENTSGFKQADHLRTQALAEMALDFAKENLKPKGSFVAKVFRGGAEEELLRDLRKNFSMVKHFKPDSSRKQSVEIYVVATGFKG